MKADEVRALLRDEIAKAGTAKEWAAKFGMSPQLVSDTINGAREPSWKIMRALGLKRETVYYKAGT